MKHEGVPKGLNILDPDFVLNTGSQRENTGHAHAHGSFKYETRVTRRPDPR